jgi:hypothetical protein
MYICQWHLDVPFGNQAEAVAIMRAWAIDKFAASEFRRTPGTRVLVGHVGVSASHIYDEWAFASLADFEAALGGMAAPQFRRHAEALAPYIVPGSQHWRIFRVAAEVSREATAQ